MKHFWETRELQTDKQGTVTGRKDYGSRSAVTGGAQLDGFASLVHDLLTESGIPHPNVYKKRGATILPGYFRGTKQWDLVVVSDGILVASIEFKSHIGSFGNNVNNRMEEAVGSATD
ncbi:MAG: PaeR7I family type II restriction endonuclease [Dehalococcoidia bacterium]